MKDPTDMKYSPLCKGAFEYEGDKPCAYNIARAFVESREFLKKNVATSEEQWQWQNVHTN